MNSRKSLKKALLDKVFGWIDKSGVPECLFSFLTGAAGAAVGFASFVARPCAGKVYAEPVTNASDFRLGYVYKGGTYADTVVGTLLDRLRHGGDKGFSAVWIQGMVTRVRGDKKCVGFSAFRDTRGDGEHDAISKGDDSLCHVLFVILSIRDVASSQKQGRVQMSADGAYIHYFMGNAENIRLDSCAG